MENIIFCYILRSLTIAYVPYICKKDDNKSQSDYTDSITLVMKELASRIKCARSGQSHSVLYTDKITSDFITYFSDLYATKTAKQTAVFLMMNFVIHQKKLVLVENTTIFFKFLLLNLKNPESKFINMNLIADMINQNKRIKNLLTNNLLLKYLYKEDVLTLRQVCKDFTLDYDYLELCNIRENNLANLKKFIDSQPHSKLNVQLQTEKGPALLKKLGLINRLNEVYVPEDSNTAFQFCLQGTLDKYVLTDFSESNDETVDLEKLCDEIKSFHKNIFSLSIDNLYKLDLSFLGEVDLSPLKETNIHTLILTEVQVITGLDIFAHKCKNVSKCTNKKCGTNVKVLEMVSANLDADHLTPLASNTSIEKLVIEDNYQLENLDSLRGNKTIKHLDISSNELADTDALEDMQVEELIAEACKIKTLNVFAVKYLIILGAEIRNITNTDKIERVKSGGGKIPIQVFAYKCDTKQTVNNRIKFENNCDYQSKETIKQIGLFFFNNTLWQKLSFESLTVDNFRPSQYLKVLKLKSCDIYSLSGLSDNKHIEKLDLSDSSINNIDFVANTNIRELNISCTKVKKLAPVVESKIHKLTIIDIKPIDIKKLNKVKRVMYVIGNVKGLSSPNIHTKYVTYTK